MVTINPIIKSDVPIPKIVRRGSLRGHGINMHILKRMKAGDSLWSLSKNKCLSFKHSANVLGIKLKTRRLPTGKYAFWRIL